MSKLTEEKLQAWMKVGKPIAGKSVHGRTAWDRPEIRLLEAGNYRTGQRDGQRLWHWSIGLLDEQKYDYGNSGGDA
jgi:hypothetical protein